jgi:hypothetical protein
MNGTAFVRKRIDSEYSFFWRDGGHDVGARLSDMVARSVTGWLTGGKRALGCVQEAVGMPEESAERRLDDPFAD